MTLPEDALQREAIVALLPRLRRFARTLCRNHADADDLVQSSVERALRHLATYRPDARFDSWMFKITRNAWIDEFRARRRRQRVFASEEEGDHVGDSTTDPLPDSWRYKPRSSSSRTSSAWPWGSCSSRASRTRRQPEVMDVPIGTLTSRLARGRDALHALLADAAGAPT